MHVCIKGDVLALPHEVGDLSPQPRGLGHVVRGLVWALRRASFQWLLSYLSPQVDLFAPPGYALLFLFECPFFHPETTVLYTLCQEHVVDNLPVLLSYPRTLVPFEKYGHSHAAKSLKLLFFPLHALVARTAYTLLSSHNTTRSGTACPRRVCMYASKVTSLRFHTFIRSKPLR